MTLNIYTKKGVPLIYEPPGRSDISYQPGYFLFKYIISDSDQRYSNATFITLDNKKKCILIVIIVHVSDFSTFTSLSNLK